MNFRRPKQPSEVDANTSVFGQASLANSMYWNQALTNSITTGVLGKLTSGECAFGSVLR